MRRTPQSDEHFSGALVSVSVPREDNVSVAWETNKMEPPLRRDSQVNTFGTDEKKVPGSYAEDEYMRIKGSRNTLIRIDYDTIGRMAGVAGDSAKQYAHRGNYDSRSLDSVLRWVNGRRAAKGLPLIGLPSENAPNAENCSDGSSNMSPTPAPPSLDLSGGYDPLLGGYRSDGGMGGIAYRR